MDSYERRKILELRNRLQQKVNVLSPGLDALRQQLQGITDGLDLLAQDGTCERERAVEWGLLPEGDNLRGYVNSLKFRVDNAERMAADSCTVATDAAGSIAGLRRELNALRDAFNRSGITTAVR